MDRRQFDALARTLGTPGSRRKTLAALLGSALGLLTLAGPGSPEDAEAKKHRRKKRNKRQKRQKRQRRRQRRKSRAACGDVCASGCSFSRVQDAIDAATEGATLRLCAGSYGETLRIAKDLTLIGAGDGEGGTNLGGQVNGSVVDVASGATVTLGRLHITSANNGGRGISNRGTLTLTDSTIANNVGDNGGGVYNVGSLTLIDCSVTDNAATEYGGGVYNEGTLIFNGGSVTGNATSVDGGGIYNVANGTVTLTDSTVTGNVAFVAGGGIYNEGTVTLTGSSVTDNYPGNCVGVAGCSG